jgi:hypothetical protein
LLSSILIVGLPFRRSSISSDSSFDNLYTGILFPDYCIEKVGFIVVWLFVLFPFVE